MKKILVLSLALSIISCKKEDNTNESASFSDAVSNVKNLKNLSNSMDDINKNIENLKKVTPLTNDEIKSVIPETLDGMKRTEITVGDNTMMQMTTAEAIYQNDESKSIRLNIMDGAGETGSGMIGLLMMGFTANTEKTTETGFEKITEVNGTKMSVKENKEGENVSSEIQFVAKNRYLVSLDGEGFTYDELAKAANEIDLSKLK